MEELTIYYVDVPGSGRYKIFDKEKPERSSEGYTVEEAVGKFFLEHGQNYGIKIIQV